MLLGKAELLAWAASVTEISPCEKYGDLKDGLIYLALARQLFPDEIDSAIVRLQRRGARDATKNWSLLISCLRRHGIPTHLCSRQAVERGHTRHCFNLLVLFYFLVRLACGDLFAVDFAQPVDPQLAAFLQSPDSVLAVERKVGVGIGRGSSNNANGPAVSDDEADGRADPGPQCCVTRLSSPPSVAAPPVTAARLAPMVPPLRPNSLSDDSSSVHLARPTQRMWARKWSSPHVPQNAVAWRTPEGYNSRGAGDSKHAPRAIFDSVLVHEVERTPAAFSDELVTALLASPTAHLSFSPFAVHGTHLCAQNQLLREELRHVKAVSQLLLAQQQGSEAAAKMRASATLHDQLAKAELDHLHEVRQLEARLATASVQHDRAGGARSPQQWAALAHRAETAEATAAQLHRDYLDIQQVYDSALQQIHQAFCSVADIAAVALSSVPSTSAYAGATAYEETVMAAMMAQLTGVPVLLKDAFHAQLRTLLLALNSQRNTNARLHLDAASFQHHRDAPDAVGNSTSELSALRAFFPLPFEQESVEIACAEARSACQDAKPAVQRALRCLTHLVDVLSRRLDTVQQDRDRWEQRCRCAEAATSQAGIASQRVRAEGEAEYQQEWETQTGTSSTPMGELSRLCEERRVRAERALQESRRLCSRVQEVLTMAFSTPGTHDMQRASDELVALLGAYVKVQGSNPAMEEALAEQAETIAALRVDLRQQREARKRAEEQLNEGERRRQELEHKCAALRVQLRSVTEKSQAQNNDSDSYAVALHRALLEKASSPSSAAHEMTPSAKPSATTTHDTKKHVTLSDAAPLACSPCHASSTPKRSSTHARYSSPRLPGALRSPATSDDDADDARERRLLVTEHRFHTDVRHHHAPPSPSLSTSIMPSSSSATTAEAGAPKALTTGRADVKTRQAGPTVSQAGRALPPAGLSTDAPGPALLLSAAELERRKEAILRKYEVP
ncbi:hypothetical protein JIQ42_00415 [Leishmania sp. Namibia]|uniref:hypothetical protein n=1 Tax=Leishmania sp. Namibia TaxID=2802991 RepID=UPI001B3E1BA3|nr:hypothetical protein JIQ42_00415 [Leishmania sp. Namibia]